MMRRWTTTAAAVAMGLTLAVAGVSVVGTRAEQAKPAAGPTFRVDATWPQEFPNHWVMGVGDRRVRGPQGPRLDHAACPRR